MEVKVFDVKKGAYAFGMSGIATEMHAHPAYEIIWSESGTFSIATEETVLDDLTLVAIPPNLKHKLNADACQLQVRMFEHREVRIKSILHDHDFMVRGGIYYHSSLENQDGFLEKLWHEMMLEEFPTYHDERVVTCLDLLGQKQVHYHEMMMKIGEAVHLSESRISHLFKEHVGVSLKKYLLWNKLKWTIHTVLTDGESLFSSALIHGFFDQPHLSRTFKEMLGISPSLVYNSRTIQNF
jgi:AraC-like DNA-binding protein